MGSDQDTSDHLVRVVVADDDVIVLAGIEALLETVDGIEVVGRAGSLDELMEAVAQHQPNVVITDIRMPPTGVDEGVQAARQLRQAYPAVGVVVLSQYVEPSLAHAVLEDGSRGRGYLLKEHVANVNHLVEAIRTVAANGSFLDTSVVDALIAARTGGPGTELGRLTSRELEVLREMAAGCSNAAIAETLFIGERAVEKNISSIFTKLSLSNDSLTHRRVSAVLLYLANEPNLGIEDGQ